MTTKELPNFDSLWNYNDPQATRKKFEKIYAEYSETAPQDYLLSLKTQIARTFSLKGSFSEAHKILDSVEDQLVNTIVKIRYYLERGRTFNSDHKFSAGLPLFLKAYDLSIEEKEDFFAIDAAHMLAIASKKIEEQNEWSQKGINLAEDSSDPKAKKWLGSLYNNLGWGYQDIRKHKEALDLFKKAQKHHEDNGNDQGEFIARWTVAHCYRSMNEFDQAIEILVELESIMEEKDSLDGYVYEELAENYLSNEEDEKSKIYFKKAYDELSKDSWLAGNEAKRLQRMKDLSLVE